MQSYSDLKDRKGWFQIHFVEILRGVTGHLPYRQSDLLLIIVGINSCLCSF